MKKIAIPALGLFLLFTLSNCSKKPNPPALSDDKRAQLENSVDELQRELDNKSAALQAERQRQQAEEASTDTGSNEKLATYVRCYNFVSNKVELAVGAYLQWAPKEGLSVDIMRKMVQARGGKIGHPFPFPLMEHGFPAACPMRIQDVAKIKPSLGNIDTTAQAYADHLNKMVVLFTNMNTYYREEGYNRDNGAAGLAFHKDLVTENDAFSSSLQSFGREVSAIENKLLREKLAQLTSVPGKKLPALLTSFVTETKNLTDLMENTVLPAVEDGPSPEALKKFEDQLAKVKGALGALTDLAAVYKSNPHGSASNLVPKSFDMLTEAGAAFVVEAETFVTRHSKSLGERYTPAEWKAIDADRQEFVTGAPGALIRSRNELIGAVNANPFPHDYNDAPVY